MTVLSTVKLKTYRVYRVLRIGLENIEGKIYRNVVTTYSPTIRVLHMIYIIRTHLMFLSDSFYCNTLHTQEGTEVRR